MILNFQHQISMLMPLKVEKYNSILIKSYFCLVAYRGGGIGRVDEKVGGASPPLGGAGVPSKPQYVCSIVVGALQ